MANNSQMGTGATITFSFYAPNTAQSFVGKYRKIGGVGRSIEVLDDTVLSTTGYKEKRPGDLADTDPIQCEIFTDADNPVPLGMQALITINYPPKTGQVNGAVFTASGFVSQDSGADLAPGVQLQSTFQLVLDGKVVKPTWTAGNNIA